MFKQFNKTTRIFGGLIALVIILFVILIIASPSKSKEAVKPAIFSNESASSDNKVEALKTMTANLVAVESQNELLRKEIEALKMQSQQAVQTLHQTIDDRLNTATEALQKEAQQSQQQIQNLLKQHSAHDYPIVSSEKETTESKSHWHWISDLSAAYENHLTESADPVLTKTASMVVQHDALSTETTGTLKKIKPKPIYTIPVNATLTGASLMTPLVGRIPMDGNLADPYPFKAILSAGNLTANGYPLPGVKGAVVSGVARGDLLASCARGDIKSMTFVFNDGRISTTEVKGDQQSLGYLSQEDGNPCIPGQFKSSEGVVLGMSMGLNFAKGYAEGIANSQYMRTMTPDGSNVAALMGSSTKVGIGEGLSSAATGAQNWWDRRVRNTFDFVFVPNWVAETQQVLKVDINMTQQISIDYDTKARKVNYETKNNEVNDVLD